MQASDLRTEAASLSELAYRFGRMGLSEQAETLHGMAFALETQADEQERCQDCGAHDGHWTSCEQYEG